MQYEENDQINERPSEESKGPKYLLLGLAGLLIAVLAYGCWDNSKTETAQTEEFTLPDTTATATSIPAPTTETVATPPVETQTAPPVVETQPAPTTTTTVSTPAVVETKPAATPKAEPAPAKTADVSSLKGENYQHTVGDGETFLGIANRYNLKLSTLQSLNPGVDANTVKSGITKLNVKIQGKHTVGAGDILRVVGNKYGVTVEQLMAVNKKKSNTAARGEVLIIPVSNKQ